jgi:ABC-type transport system involved in multi-copper enzyme maturation permease subunit
MTGAITSELLILRKRAATWVLLAIWTALAVFFTYVLPYVIERNRDGASSRPLEDLMPDRLVGSLSGGYPFFGGAIALILAVMTIGGEYSWGAWKTLFTQRPGRLQVFAAKLIALGVALVPFVVTVFLAGAVSSFLVARSEGAAVTWPSAGLLLRGFLADWLILAVWASLGVLLAVLTRGVAMAMGIGILYALVVEGLLTALTGAVDRLEPAAEFFLRANTYSLISGVGASVEAAADNGPGAFSGPYVDGVQAALALIAYTAIFLGMSAYVLRRRDVV